MYLNCKSWFSLLYGTFRTEELVTTAAGMGVQRLALTNINSTSDAWDFVEFCREHAVKPILGTEVRNDHVFCYILLAKNNAGFLFINRFLSEHLEQKLPFPERPPGNPHVFVIYPLGKFQPGDLSDDELIGVQVTEVTKLFTVNTRAFPGKFVVRHPVTFQEKKYYNVHRLLRAIDKNIVLSKQQPQDYAGEHEKFISPGALMQHFSDHPSIITNTLERMQACSIEMTFHEDKTKKRYSATAADDKKFLEKLALTGMERRYGKNNQVARDRVAKELKIISDLEFNTYFLVTWDIIRYARNRQFFFVGRGSGANSIVAYCLEITDVDPLELDLYFERFLNPYRKSPPDFDIDFSWKDRDEIIDYIFKRFGREHVSLLGAYTTFQKRSVIRELGKVFGLPTEEIDALDHPATVFKADPIHRKIQDFGRLMKDFPHHLSIHAGGVLISDAPIHQYSVTALPPKGFNTSQIDMFVAEKIGLFKLDILSQRGLGHIRETVEIVLENRQEQIDILQVEKFKQDKKVAAQIRDANTIGCFYIESPGMRQLLKKLECDDYLTLVAASSIIRPGVSQSGMMRQYIYRYHNPNDFEYLHPKMKELLEETYGVMVYQEDVIKVAHHFAKLDMGEADVLRRAMSGKYRGQKQFELIRAKFFVNCKNEGYPDEISREVWRQIESFGGYSFSKAHSASFAVESYQSLYLKTYYPAEFMVAVINNFGGFYNRELYFHELKKTGVELLPPCINEGAYLTLIRGNIVYVGFIHVDGLEEKEMQRVLHARSLYGPYLHLADFIERTGLGLEQVNLLVRIGAFRFTGKNKKELLWEANFLRKKTSRLLAANPVLFHEPPVAFTLPVLKQDAFDDAMDETELLGFPLCDIWRLVNADLAKFADASMLPAFEGRAIRAIGYYVTDKPVRTSKGEMMFFGTFLDKKGEWLDTVHFPQSFRYSPFQGRGFYDIRGTVVMEFGVFSVEVHSCEKVGIARK